jgi:hypothetical protein
VKKLRDCNKITMSETLDLTLERYVLGNLAILPRDILGVIVAQMDRKALLNLCVGNKGFIEYCKESNWFNKKALEYIQNTAPLSGHFRTLEEQAALIEKNFKSCYIAVISPNEFHPGKWDTNGVYFYNANWEDYPLNGGFLARFEILGLPPRKETKVWLVGIRLPLDHYATNTSVFTSQEEAIEHLKSKEGNDQFRIDSRMESYDGTFDELITELMINGTTTFNKHNRRDARNTMRSYFFFMEISLP